MAGVFSVVNEGESVTAGGGWLVDMASRAGSMTSGMGAEGDKGDGGGSCKGDGIRGGGGKN
jgi:hypothetical protein